MQRIAATVVALVGVDAAGRADEVGRSANVLGVVPEPAEPLQRAEQAWGSAARSSRTYVVHDADPLGAVAERWVDLYDGNGIRGDLETAVAAVAARWRQRALELPDYYLVLDAEDLPPTARHWFLGVLRDAAPARVVPVASRPGAVEHELTRLPAGRWWPDLPDLLAGIDEVAPDDVETASRPPDPQPLRF